MAKRHEDKALLLATARQLVDGLKLSDGGSGFRIRRPARVSTPRTDGWRTVIGDLGKNQPRLELWFDRFSGFSERKFFACFFSEERGKLTKLVRRVSPHLGPVRTITLRETVHEGFFALDGRLKPTELAHPIMEIYEGETFFGIYDSARRNSATTVARFCSLAAAFIFEVAESRRNAKGRPIGRDNFPRCEDRKRVRSHLRRERSGYLATQCKERDGYRCQVCGMNFAEVYGNPVGDFFAEAHHLRPLGQLGNKVKTRVEELITVCANCHRMLHRMDGPPDDVANLRTMFRNRAKAHRR